MRKQNRHIFYTAMFDSTDQLWICVHKNKSLRRTSIFIKFAIVYDITHGDITDVKLRLDTIMFTYTYTRISGLSYH